MKKVSKSRKRKKPTWTFQPDEDVRKLVDQMLGQISDADRTALINEAIRLKHADVARAWFDSEILRLQAKRESLPKKPGDTD